MTPEEIALIQSKQNAAIVAAAGHGKTEMIVDLVEASSKKVLLVTHTNAGIDALTKRLRKRGVDSKRYSITTIAGFCLRWCSSYPRTAGINNIPVTDRDYYPMQYKGAVAIFQKAWAREVIQRTYGSIIVDEYQDCVLVQHQIFIEINKSVPVIVFGDPLQAIFGWAGKLVSWNNLCFERVNINTYPWRWRETNPALGQYLNNIRSTLEPGLSGKCVTIPVKAVAGCIQVLPTSCKNDATLINLARRYKDTVFITKWKRDQEAFSRGTGGAFQNDEAQNMSDLFEMSKVFDMHDGTTSATGLVAFLEMCATGIKTELASYKRNIQVGNYNFSRIKKHPEFGKLIKTVYETTNNESIIAILDWVVKEPSIRLHRKELFSEMRRALVYSCEKNISVFDAAQRIRTISGLQHPHPKYRMMSSRTVLSKGLEFDCVIVDLEKGMSVTDYYVALTRAKKQIILISDHANVTLDAPRLYN